MMASSNLISNHPAVTNSDRARELTRKKKKKKSIIISQEGTTRSEDPNNNNQNSTRRGRRRRTTTATTNTTTAAAQWKSEAQQQVYSSKLLQALRHVRLTSSSPTSTPKPGRAVRQAADRVLAVAAKGKTRWSRAILTNRLKLKFMKNSNNNNNNNNKRQRSVAVTSTARSKKPRVSILLRLNKTKNLPAVQRKARVLGRLVPGCRKEPLPVILEEATDYIAALEMQVRAMAALADLLSGPASSRPPTT